MTEFHGQNSALNCAMKFYRLPNMMIKTSFLGNGTILTLHIIPSRKLHKVSFEMTYNVAVYTVATLNSSDNAILEPLDCHKLEEILRKIKYLYRRSINRIKQVRVCC